MMQSVNRIAIFMYSESHLKKIDKPILRDLKMKNLIQTLNTDDLTSTILLIHLNERHKNTSKVDVATEYLFCGTTHKSLCGW